MKNNELPIIYEYNDFRKFITDFQSAMHERDKRYTKSYMSVQLGLPNSRSYLTHVVNGKKVSDTFVERFIHLFEFNKSEADYFRVLVMFNQAENPDEREMYFEQLIARNKTPKRYLYEASFQYYRHWYNAGIRALLNVYDFDGVDFSELAKKFAMAISASEAKKAFKLLLKLNLITKCENGFYKPTSQSICTEEFVKNEALQVFQIQSLELAKFAVLNDLKQPKFLATNTISISRRGSQRIDKLIDRFRSQVRSLVHKDENRAETVYQLDVLFFPLLNQNINKEIK
jgi:uncharacterized protein (TIGR02147 family)